MQQFNLTADSVEFVQYPAQRDPAQGNGCELADLDYSSIRSPETDRLGICGWYSGRRSWITLCPGPQLTMG